MSLRTMLTRLCLYLKISRNILHRSQQLAIWTVYNKTNLQIKHTLSDFWSRRCLWQISQKLGRQSENMSFTCPSIIPLKFKSIVSRPDLHDVKNFLKYFVASQGCLNTSNWIYIRRLWLPLEICIYLLLYENMWKNKFAEITFLGNVRSNRKFRVVLRKLYIWQWL